jgi:hypothetical protein
MKLTDEEKTIITDLIKRFIVDKETFLDENSNCYYLYMPDLGYSGFENKVYGQLKFILSNMTKDKSFLNPTNFWQYDWSNDFENYVKSDPNYCSLMKKNKEKMKLNNIKTDF